MPFLIFNWEHLPCHKENRKEAPWQDPPPFPFCELHILQQEQSSFPSDSEERGLPLILSPLQAPLLPLPANFSQLYLRSLKVTCLVLIRWMQILASLLLSVRLPFLKSPQAQVLLLSPAITSTPHPHYRQKGGGMGRQGCSLRSFLKVSRGVSTDNKVNPRHGRT